MKQNRYIISFFVFMTVNVLAIDFKLEDIGVFKHPKNELAIIGGSVTLPGEGVWRVVPSSLKSPALAEISLTPPQEVIQASLGNRVLAMQVEQRKQSHQGSLRYAYWLLKEWAMSNEGTMPARTDLDKKGRERLDHALNSLESLDGEILHIPSAPHSALVPNAIFKFKKLKPKDPYYHAKVLNAAPVLVELHPKEDDGKHYVLRTDGKLKREPIDAELIKKLGVEIIPLTLNPEFGTFPKKAAYKLVARQNHSDATQFAVTNATTHSTLIVGVPQTEGMNVDTNSLLQKWGKKRQANWRYLAKDFDAPGLRVWHWVQNGMMETYWSTDTRRRSQDTTTDMLGVMGGQAALRETLQLEALQMNESSSTNRLPLSSIKGVEVKSHPFEKMLGKSQGGSYPIANVVPRNRFFLGVSKPDSLLPILDDGAAFLSKIGAGATGRALHYGLKDRYLQALGLNESLLRTLLKTKVIREIALFSPDLFYVDGTEITCVVRMRGASGMKSLLRLIGISTKAGKPPMSIKTKWGGKAWWAIIDDLVVISTKETEAQSVMDLAEQNGKGSLGLSAEFRYLLTRVPLTEQTRAYVYFSDPFIRRLVGPEVKIGQLRRLHEKSKMQAMAYASMLYTYDGLGESPSMDQLISSSYLPSHFNSSNLSFGNAHFSPISTTYGDLPRMKSIHASDLSKITTSEAEAYKRYKDRYSRYWRRFFDPIAMRIDEEDQELVATTYILPLIDNSLYEGVQEVVNNNPAHALLIPQLNPMPSAMLSLNLNENIWKKGFKELFGRASRMSPEMSILDQFGPAFHFATFDADPIIAVGSRSLLGMGGKIGSFNDDMMIPLFVSALTRPCAMLIELQNPESVREFLMADGLKNIISHWGREMNPSSYKEATSDRWIASMDVFGLSLRFSFAIDDNYLVIENMPWRKAVAVISKQSSSVSGASVLINPSAAKIEQRALYLSAMEGQRLSVMEGLAYLYPLLASGVPPKKALAQHKQIFGFEPVFPGDVSPSWNGISPLHADFGTLLLQEQPTYDPEKLFGTFQDIDRITASMQFEASGLRTIVRWKYNKP